jgi:multidrug efflux pump subunit AcrB
LLRGVARYLLPPLALAVVAAMLTSYLLSRTLVPAMASYLLPEYSVEAPPSGLAGCFHLHMLTPSPASSHTGGLP